jgi:DNA polymerase III epsilon subunit-like protein
MKRHNLAFIDLETTGLSPDRHEIIEIGGLIVKQIPQAGRGPKLEVIDEFEFKVKPEHIETAESEALRINGYNEADWLFAPGLKEVMEVVADKTRDACLVGFNIYFDWKFLEAAFAKTGVVPKMHYHRIEVMSMALVKLYHDEQAHSFSLKGVAERLGVKNEQAHTALSDIKATFEIYKKLLEA